MKNLKNSEYWKKRYEALQESLLEPTDKYCEELKEIYKNTIKDIEKEISVWYQRFADNNGIVSMAEARKRLNKKDLEELLWDVEQYIKAGEENGITKDWSKELENASARWHISRLEALKIQTQQKIEELYGGREDKVKALLGDIYTEGNYKNAYEIAQRTGATFEFAKIDDNKLNKVLNKPWTVDDKTFSERIWQDRKKLVNTVHQELTKGILTGNSPLNISKVVSKKMNSDLYSAQRLVLTESTYFATEAQKDCYNSLGVEKYEVLETLDGSTCEECGAMDGKVFDRKDMTAGVNAPPFHPNCRGTTVPYFDDEFTEGEKRAARDKSGNTVYVKDMSYEEWKEKFVTNDVEKPAENDIIESEHEVTEGKCVIGEWSPREDYDYDIDDIINYQGFDGNPRVVNNREEFEKLINEDSFIAERTFSSDDPELVELWDNQLKCENGENYFYVNCENGGAQYGQGMYCAADYTKGTVSQDSFNHEIQQYTWGRKYTKTNWLTMDKTASIINFDDVDKMYNATKIDTLLNKYELSESQKNSAKSYFEYYNKMVDAANAYNSSVGGSTRAELRGLEQDFINKNNDVFDANMYLDKDTRVAVEAIKSEMYKERKASYSKVPDISRWDDLKDMGVKAAEMGYDAINAAGHGAMGSYTVVLNRTKLIIYGGDDYVYKEK